MVMQWLKSRSAAEYTGMFAIGAVVAAAWMYSILLEYQFFATVTPSSQPIFPYLGLAFTGVGFMLWGIGFLCARKPFTMVTCMIMGLASGATAFTIAYMEFTTAGDARYNLAADPNAYKNALSAIGVMLLLNVVSGALKAIAWRFSQPGTGFFEHPQVAIPYQQPQPYYIQQSAPAPQVQVISQPKEEREMVLEQVAPAYAPRTRKDGKAGRKHTEEEYARMWLRWQDNGFTDETCPWENPSAFRYRYPDAAAVARVLATANR